MQNIPSDPTEAYAVFLERFEALDKERSSLIREYVTALADKRNEL